MLRVEYASQPDANGDIESGVVFWRRESIRGEEIPDDLLERLGNAFPVVFQLDRKLANACFVTSSGFGLTLLDRAKSNLKGPLWLTVDAGWTIEFSLRSDGSVDGKTGYYFANEVSSDATLLKGTHRDVADFCGVL